MIWRTYRLRLQKDLVRWFEGGTWTDKPSIQTRREAFAFDENIMSDKMNGLLVKVEADTFLTFLGLTGSRDTITATVELISNDEDMHDTQVSEALAILNEHALDSPYADVIVRGSHDNSNEMKHIFETMIDVEARLSIQ